MTDFIGIAGRVPARLVGERRKSAKVFTAALDRLFHLMALLRFCKCAVMDAFPLPARQQVFQIAASIRMQLILGLIRKRIRKTSLKGLRVS